MLRAIVAISSILITLLSVGGWLAGYLCQHRPSHAADPIDGWWLYSDGFNVPQPDDLVWTAKGADGILSVAFWLPRADFLFDGTYNALRERSLGGRYARIISSQRGFGGYLAIHLHFAVLALVAALPGLVLFLHGWLRMRRRRKRGACQGCGYDRRGDMSKWCPECGRADYDAATIWRVFAT